MQQEKRLYKRISLSLPINYESLNIEKKEYNSTVSKDIGEGGIRLVFNKFYTPRTRFLLKINIEGINRIIEAIAEIVWSFNAQFSNAYYSGLQFVELNNSGQKILKEYLQMQEITKT